MTTRPADHHDPARDRTRDHGPDDPAHDRPPPHVDAHVDPDVDHDVDPHVAADEFADVDEVRARFTAAGYLPDDRLAMTVFLQSRLGKPVLLEGPAGVGKTELATTLAAVTGRRLLRLQCYEGQDETRALYEWDYGKQLLYTQMLRDKISQVVADTDTLDAAVERIAAQDSAFFSDHFLAPRPLLQAVRSDVPVVLLIDEVDRSDEALEAVLLEMLAEFQVSVPEIGTFTATHQPWVVLTSNDTRDLSAALKRRCLHLFLDYPDAERELAIIRSKQTGLSDELARQLVAIVRQLRELDLRKPPSISETIDWARTLAVLGAEELDARLLSQTVSAVIKYEKDLGRATRALPDLLDPNVDVPDRDHDHDHDHGHDRGRDARRRPPGGEADVDGREVRRAKDEPGRHDDDYYGSPGATGPTAPRRVTSSQGSRSFPAGRGRRDH